MFKLLSQNVSGVFFQNCEDNVYKQQCMCKKKIKAKERSF